MLNKSGIYKIFNVAEPDKFYIGSSKNIAKRWTKHRWSARNEQHQYQSYLYNAIQKHGMDNFTIEVVEECDSLVLREREQYYIDILQPVYNVQTKVNFNAAEDWSVDRREEYSQRRKEEVANGINVPPKVDWNGREHTEESKEKMREGNLRAREKAIAERGYYMSPEAKESMKAKIQESLTPEKRKWFREQTKENAAMGRAKVQKEAEDFAKQYVSLIEDKQHEGMNLREIARFFNSEGHRTRLGNEWTDQSIREVLKKFGKQPTGENSNNYRVLQEQKKQADDFAKKFIDIIRLKLKEGLAIVEIADYLNSQGFKTRRNKDWAELAVRQILKRFPEQQPPKRKTIKPDIDPRPQIVHNKKILGWDKRI